MKKRIRVVLACGTAAALGAVVAVAASVSTASTPDGSSLWRPGAAGSSGPRPGSSAPQPGSSGSSAIGSSPTGPAPSGGGPKGSGPGGTASRPTEAAGASSTGTPTLITNEYAYHHQGSPDAVRSPDWIVTSGSLYAAGDLLWSGRPDDRSPGPTSALGTDSAVLRAVSTRNDHNDVRVSFAVQVAHLVQTARTPAIDTDGVHVILRYQSEFSTYYVSVFRRDGELAIKKKVPGGPSNGGTYLTLASTASAVAMRTGWHQVEATISDTGSGSARLTLRLDGRPALDVVDSGANAPVIASPGRVGLRGDNCEFYVRDFRVVPRADP